MRQSLHCILQVDLSKSIQDIQVWGRGLANGEEPSWAASSETSQTTSPAWTPLRFWALKVSPDQVEDVQVSVQWKGGQMMDFWVFALGISYTPFWRSLPPMVSEKAWEQPTWVWIYKRGSVPQHAVAAEKPNTALNNQKFQMFDKSTVWHSATQRPAILRPTLCRFREACQSLWSGVVRSLVLRSHGRHMDMGKNRWILEPKTHRTCSPNETCSRCFLLYFGFFGNVWEMRFCGLSWFLCLCYCSNHWNRLAACHWL